MVPHSYTVSPQAGSRSETLRERFVKLGDSCTDADTEAWETLKTNLDADRLSDRPLFP